MATQVQVYRNFNFIPKEFSDISTQGEDQHINFCKQICFKDSFRFSQPQKCKIKSSLCKNFAQTGLCPYRQKCKFAHGTHELRCNSEINIAYKTRYCNSFLNKKYCSYGIRCNFIHKSKSPIDEAEKWKAIYNNHREVFKESQKNHQSRLLTILKPSIA